MRIRRNLSVLLAAAALAAAAPSSSPAQDGAPSTAEAATAPAPAYDAAAAQEGASSSGLPVGTPPPATMRAYAHVFAAYALAWILLFGFVVSIARRFARVEREARALGA